MNLPRIMRFALGGLLAACGLLQAQYVFPLPPSSIGTTAPILDSQLVTLTSIGKPAGSTWDLMKVLYLPAVDKYYVVNRASDNAVFVVAGWSLTTYKTISLDGDVPKAALITPDGNSAVLLGSKLHIIDGETDTELTPSVSVGDNPDDFVVSQDSQFAYVLNTTSRTITKVDLAAHAVANAISYSGTAKGIGVSPDGNIYVTRVNVIVEYDGDTLGEIRTIPVTGAPLKPDFSADGRYLIAADSPVAVGHAPSSSAVLVDLKATDISQAARYVKPTNPSNGAVLTFSKVFIAGDGVAYALAPTPGTIYRLTWYAFAAEPVGFGADAGGTTTGITDMAITREYPSSKKLYYLRDDTINLYDIAADQLVQTRDGYRGTLSLAGPVSTAQVRTILKFNDVQKGDLGATLKPLVLRAFDEDGNPVYHATVNFTTEAEGLVIHTTQAVTNADGYASTLVTLPDQDGRFEITATVLGEGTQAVFVVLAGTGVNPGGGGNGGGTTVGGLFKTAGDGEVILERIFSPDKPLTVVARSEDGTPVAGQTITWSVVPVSDGPAVYVQQAATTTNQDGSTSNFVTGAFPLPPGRSYLQSKVIATWADYSAVFWVSTVPVGSSPIRIPIKPSDTSNYNITGGVGEIIPGAIQLRILAPFGTESGRPMPNVGLFVDNTGKDPALVPTAECVGLTALSDADGLVSCDLKIGPVKGQTYLTMIYAGNQYVNLNISLTVTAGSPSSIAIIQGNNQSGEGGATLGQTLIGEVRNAVGAPLAAQATSWSVEPPEAATLINAGAATNINGRVSAQVKLGNTSGPFKVRLISGVAEAEFNLAVNVVAGRFVKIGGDAQTALVGEQFALPVRARVTDSSGHGIEGLNVTFTVIQGSATLGSHIVPTDSEGYASTTVTAGSAQEEVLVRAVVTGFTQPLQFTLNSVLPGPQVTAANFVDYASQRPVIGPGSLFVLSGAGIGANVTGLASAPPFSLIYPTTLAGLTVKFINPDGSGYWAPILYILHDATSEYAVCQVPFEVAPGTVSAEVAVSGGMATVEGIQVAKYAPGFMLNYSAGSTEPIAIAQRPDGSLVTTANPARRGEVIKVYMIGLGQTTPPMSTDALSGPDQEVNAIVIIGINHAGVPILSAKAAQNLIGLYVVEFVVPEDAPTGDAIPLDTQVWDRDTVPESERVQIAGPGTKLPIGN